MKKAVEKDKNPILYFTKISKLYKVNTLSYKTLSAKKETVERKWHIVDAEGQVVGRMSSQIAHILRGKHKPSFTPHVDTGDFVIVINAEKARFTGNKMKDKQYLSHSGYMGGQKSRTPAEYMVKKPIFPIEHAVKGMLPKNKLGRAMFKKLFVYAGGEHPHVAQKPEKLEFTK